MDICLTVTDNPPIGVRETLVRGLNEHATHQATAMDAQPLAVLLTSAAAPDAIGGLWGRTYYGWLYVELLFVPPELRGRQLGRQLLAAAETAARQRGCQQVWLSTFSFQAKEFYEKAGFTVFGQLDDYPLGFGRFFLKKTL